jgi:hypothetical protein
MRHATPNSPALTLDERMLRGKMYIVRNLLYQERYEVKGRGSDAVVTGRIVPKGNTRKAKQGAR